MKCCECSKEVDVSKSDVPPAWFGKYEGDKQVAVICATCIKQPEKLKKWRVE